MRVAALIFVCIAIQSTCSGVAYLRLDSGIVETRLKQAPVDAASRLTLLRKQFREAGCDPKTSREQKVEGGESPTLICTMPGSAKGTIIFAASLDYEFTKDESETGWASVAMLPLLAESLNGSNHRCTYVFIAFSGRNKLAGSSAYLAQLSDAQRSSIVAMIDLDGIGRTDANYTFPGPRARRDVYAGRNMIAVVDPHEETPLSQMFRAAASTLRQDAPAQSLDLPPVTDAETFEKSKIPTLIITSPAYVIVTSPGDIKTRILREKVDLKAYYKTYNLLCVYGLHLDQAFGRSAAKIEALASAETQIGEHLLATINSLRTSASLPALTLDPMLAADAKQRATAFASNQRLGNESKIGQRIPNLGMTIAEESEVWFVFPEEAAKDDALIRESIGEEARASLLDARFGVAGVAVTHRGKSFFAVVNLVGRARDNSAADVESALLAAIQQSRRRQGFVEFRVARSSEELRAVACSMAKQDSLQAGIDAVEAPKVFAFTSANPESSSWVAQIAAYGAPAGPPPQIKLDELIIGVCRANGASVPNETFWVIVELNRLQ